MKKETYELFKSADIDTIVLKLENELKTRNESPFWSDKVIPFTKSILSILIPLRDKKILFNPEGEPELELTPELFLVWSDFVSLKHLAFRIQKSNEAGELIGTYLDADLCQQYDKIDLSLLGNYLTTYRVNLENETLDFPISSYNLHQGVSNVIKSLM
jgi:hypothetical protein